MAWNGYNTYFGGYQPGGYAQGQAMPYGQAQAVPQMQNQPQAQQGAGGLIWVQGETGAKSFLVAPGQSVMLMDSEGSKFYIKSADASGMPMPLRIFEFREILADGMAQNPQNSVVPSSDGGGRYVTREELEARLAQILATGRGQENATEVKENG